MDDLENSLLTATSLHNNFKTISYKEKLDRAFEELQNTNPETILKFWREERDSLLWWLYWWKIYLIWADTWVGKSTFVNQICNNVSNAWHKVMKYSLEDRMEDIGKEELFYITNRLRYKDKQPLYTRVKFVNNEYNDEPFWYYVKKAYKELTENNNTYELDKTKQVNIDELVSLMEDECDKWVELFAIDHLHYFEMWNSQRHDIEIQNVMHRINEVARQRNVVILLVAHYKSNKAFGASWVPSYDDFKDWASIKQVANVIIQITRDIAEWWTSEFHITKLRWPVKPTIIETSFNLNTFEYDFTKTDQQLEKEKWLQII